MAPALNPETLALLNPVGESDLEHSRPDSPVTVIYRPDSPTPYDQFPNTSRHRRTYSSLEELASIRDLISADREHRALYDRQTTVISEEEASAVLAAAGATDPDPGPDSPPLPPPHLIMTANSNHQNNHFPNFESNGGRQAASPTSLHAGQVNGNGINGAVNYMAPLPVGHQQDINFLYGQIQELATILKSNREKVGAITRTAEEVARRAHGSLNDGERNKESDAARIRELELELAKANRIIDIYKHEQSENTALIGQYEDALGTATDQIRNYCCDNNDRYLAQRRHYNNLLQAEKDEHLQSRLEKDEWHAKCMRVCEMIRTAYRLRCDEWNDELVIISGLQSEVRCLRRCIGLEEEKPEEETGWPYLREVASPPPEASSS